MTESILDVSNDFWSFDSADLTWNQIPFTVPWPSTRRCVGWTPHGNSLVLWGGSGICEEHQGTVSHTFLNDFWHFDPGECKWKLLRDSDDHRHTPLADCQFPFPRYTPVFESVGQNVFLFGGYTEDRLGKRKLNDAWLWPDSLNKPCYQIPLNGKHGYLEGIEWPGLHYGSMSASDDQHVYICGGYSDEGDHIDLWRFEVKRHDWQILFLNGECDQSPEPRYCAAFAMKDKRLHLFDGRSRRNPK